MDLFGEDEVKVALEDLPEHYRLPIVLADVEGFAYKEIAEILDVPIGTVMSRLHRGRKQLQKRLSRSPRSTGSSRIPSLCHDEPVRRLRLQRVSGSAAHIYEYLDGHLEVERRTIIATHIEVSR